MGYGCGFMFGLGMGYLVFSHERPKWLVNMVYGEQRNKVRRSKKNLRQCPIVAMLLPCQSP
jgi:hypothetical protein